MNARTSAVYEIRRVDGEFVIVHKCGALGFEQIVERFDRRPDAVAMLERLQAASAPAPGKQSGRASPAFLAAVAFLIGAFLILAVPSCYGAGPPRAESPRVVAPTANLRIRADVAFPQAWGNDVPPPLELRVDGEAKFAVNEAGTIEFGSDATIDFADMTSAAGRCAGFIVVRWRGEKLLIRAYTTPEDLKRRPACIGGAP